MSTPLKHKNHINHINPINPTALRKAKIVYNFGLSECKRIKHPGGGGGGGGEGIAFCEGGGEHYLVPNTDKIHVINSTKVMGILSEEQLHYCCLHSQ